MLATQSEIESLAERIERAYRLRRPLWYEGGTTPAAWTNASALLYRIHLDNPEIPLDPELFVAVQPAHPAFADPWGELTQTAAGCRYRSRVRQIIRGLQTELCGEVRRAEGRIRRGASIDRVLGKASQALSPLGCFITAERAGRDDLADHFRAEAVQQYRSCPLYRQALLRLLPPENYPAAQALVGQAPTPMERLKRPQIHAN